jgi:signal transduction histidine kinase
MTTGDPARESVQGGLEGHAALAAHQLGEAVALIRGATAVLDSQRDRLGPGAEDALRAMTAGTERAQRFVDDMFDLVHAAQEPSDVPGADLAAALAAAQRELEPPLHRAGMRVTQRGLDGLASALGHAEAERLFVHILRCALAAGAHRVHVAAEPEGDALLLEVADDGEAPRDTADPLEPFGRPRGRGPMVGAGVSMVVCRLLVERRGGSIALTPVDDAVVVSLRLPVV